MRHLYQDGQGRTWKSSEKFKSCLNSGFSETKRWVRAEWIDPVPCLKTEMSFAGWLKDTKGHEVSIQLELDGKMEGKVLHMYTESHLQGVV